MHTDEVCVSKETLVLLLLLFFGEAPGRPAGDVLGFGFTRADLKLCPHSPHPPAVLERLFLSGNSRPTLGICEALGGEAKRAAQASRPGRTLHGTGERPTFARCL